MNKVIAINGADEQVLTTEATANKNNWWITYWVKVVPSETETTIPEATNQKVPHQGMKMTAIGGHVYQISELKPAHICCFCHDHGKNRIGNKFYCDHDFKKLVVTKPILLNGSKPQRNQPCTCNSGKKYKHCCGKQTHKPRHYFNSEYQQQKTT